MSKIQREKDRILYLEGTKRAKEYYQMFLLRLVLRRLKQAVERRRLNEVKADCCYKRHLLKICFVRWSCHTISIWQERNRKSFEAANRYASRLAFRYWKDYYLLQQSKLLVAIDWYELQMTSKIIRHWHERTRQLKQIEAVKAQRSEAHYNW